MSVSQHKTSLLKRLGTNIRLADQYQLTDISNSFTELQRELMKVDSSAGSFTEAFASLKPINDKVSATNNEFSEILAKVCRFYALNAETFYNCESKLDELLEVKCQDAIHALNEYASSQRLVSTKLDHIRVAYDKAGGNLDEFGKTLLDELMESDYDENCAKVTYDCIESMAEVEEEIKKQEVIWYKKDDLSEVKLPESKISFEMPVHEKKTIAIVSDSFINNLIVDVDNRKRITPDDQTDELVMHIAAELLNSAVNYIKDQFIAKIKENSDIIKEDYLNILSDSFKEISDDNVIELADKTLELEKAMVNLELHKGDFKYYPVIEEGNLEFVPSEYMLKIKNLDFDTVELVEYFSIMVLDPVLSACKKSYEKMMADVLKEYDGSKGIKLPSIPAFATDDLIVVNMRLEVPFFDKIYWGESKEAINTVVRDAKATLISILKERESSLIQEAEAEILKQIGFEFNKDCSRELGPFIQAWINQIEQEYAAVRSQCSYYSRLENEDFKNYYDKIYTSYFGRNIFVEWMYTYKSKNVVDKEIFNRYKYIRINGSDGRVWVHEVMHNYISNQVEIFDKKIQEIYDRWDSDVNEYEKFAISQCGHYFDDIDAIMNKEIVGKWTSYRKGMSDRSNFKANDILEFAKLSNVFNFVQKEFMDGVVREAIGFYKFQNSEGVLIESKVKSYIQSELRKRIAKWEEQAFMAG